MKSDVTYCNTEGGVKRQHNTRKEIRFLPCQGGIIKKGTIFNFADLERQPVN